MPKKTNTVASFWAQARRGDALACWEWTGQRGPRGYGKTRHDRRHWRAHRLAYAFTHPDWDGRGFVCHHCDNPPCINPAHLFLGSPKDNVADMINKGRLRDQRGEANAQSKLTVDQVREIRLTGGNQRVLGLKYGVDQSVISDIITGKLWTHV